MDEEPTSRIQVFGHGWAIELIDRQYQAGRMPQALLLTGPPRVGKSTLARFLAQYLNCEADIKPCGACRSCRKALSGSHPDIRIYDDEQMLKIDEIRVLQRELALSPYEGQFRVVVFCDFARATTSAANALLKTLEEPASQVVIILTAAAPGALLPTIVSRCQSLALRPLPVQTVSQALQTHWQANSEHAELLAQLSAGRIGWAVKALQDEQLLAHRADCLQDLLDLLRMDRAKRLAYAQALSRSQATMKETLRVWLTIWRDLLLLQCGSQTEILNLDWREQLQNIAGQSSLIQAADMVNKLRSALINLEYNVNPRLSLEVVLLRMPSFEGN
jgi:DNA polymerase-3 subunit delta'